MSSTIDPFVERRVANLVRDVLDGEFGPHRAWAESPAARRVAQRPRTIARPPLRLLAIAAVLVVGGAASVGAYLRWSQTAFPTPTDRPVTSTPSLAPSSNPSSAPPAVGRNGWIAFVTNGDLYVTHPGETPRRVFALPFDGWTQSCPRFGPDGPRLSYTQTPPVGADDSAVDAAIVSLSSDASVIEATGQLRIDEDTTDPPYCPGWSPDLTHFAYVSSPNEGSVPKIVDLGGHEVRRVELPEAFPDGVAEGFAWSPDGASLAVVRNIDVVVGESQTSELWVVPLAGSARRVLSGYPQEIIDGFAWSPDGSTIAFHGIALDTNGTFLATVDVSVTDGDRTKIDELVDAEMTAGAGPAWSPDGRLLAWGRGGELVIVAADGGERRGLPPVSSDALGLGWAEGQLIWSADGTQILSHQVDSPVFKPRIQRSVVLYDVASDTQPTGVLPWQVLNFGHLDWQVLPE